MNNLKGYVRYDGTGRMVPGSAILAMKMPKVGDWMEIDVNATYYPLSLGGMRAYVALNRLRQIIPSNNIFAKSMPRTGEWKEIYPCKSCMSAATTTTSSTTTTGIPYEDEAIALFARMGVQPSTETKGYYNTFIKGLKDNSLWDKFLVLVFSAGETEQQSLLNIVSTDFNPTFTAVNYNFTTKNGFDVYNGGIGGMAYVTTGFTPSVNGGTKYINNSCCIGCAVKYEWNSLNHHLVFGSLANKILASIDYTNNITFAINSASFNLYVSKDYSGAIYNFIRRVSSPNQVKIYENNESPSSVNRAPSSLSTGELTIFDPDGLGTDDAQLRAYWIGAEMTDEQTATFSDLLNGFLTSMGCGLY